jgi:hypothetical protein
MVRWSILKTLLWKETLRFRYNLGLLVVIGALLALSALVAVASRMGSLFGQQPTARAFYVVYDPAVPELRAFAQHLKRNLPDRDNSPLDPGRIAVLSSSEFVAVAGTQNPFKEYSPELIWAAVDLERQQPPRLRFEYHYSNPLAAEVIHFQHWCDDQAQLYLGNKLPVLKSYLPNRSVREIEGIGTEVEGGGPLSKIVTALVIFAFYLLSFNIYITTTAEEREKRALLAIVLTPARPLEIILAKVLFYATLSVIVAMGVVATYRVQLLADPLLWLTIFTGAASYVAIGTVVLCLVPRQTTINNVSMMYLIFTAIVMLLGKFLWGFNYLRMLMVENYLYRHMEQIIDGKRYTKPWFEQMMITGFTVVWIAVAVVVFRNRGVKIAHTSR